MKYFLFFLGGLILALTLFLVLTFSLEPGKSDELNLDKPIVAIFKATVTGQPMNFWNVAQEGMKEAAKEFGVEVVITGPDHEKQINRQLNILQRVIEEDPPLIILAASDYYLLAEPLKKAAEKNIPVITLDSGVNSSYPVSFIATDNLQAGVKAGGEIARLLENPEPASVAIVSHSRETATAIEREAGVRQTLPMSTVAGTWFCEIDESIAYENTMEILKIPSIKGIVALNEIVALGAGQAVADAGAAERIFVVGFDNAPKELAFLETGVIDALVVQRPYNMGYMSVLTAVEYLKGHEVQPIIDTGSVLITAEKHVPAGVSGTAVSGKRVTAGRFSTIIVIFSISRSLKPVG